MFRCDSCAACDIWNVFFFAGTSMEGLRAAPQTHLPFRGAATPLLPLGNHGGLRPSKPLAICFVAGFISENFIHFYVSTIGHCKHIRMFKPDNHVDFHNSQSKNIYTVGFQIRQLFSHPWFSNHKLYTFLSFQIRKLCCVHFQNFHIIKFDRSLA